MDIGNELQLTDKCSGVKIHLNCREHKVASTRTQSAYCALANGFSYLRQAQENVCIINMTSSNEGSFPSRKYCPCV